MVKGKEQTNLTTMLKKVINHNLGSKIKEFHVAATAT